MAKVQAQCTLCDEVIRLHQNKDIGYCINCHQEVTVAKCVAKYEMNHTVVDIVEESATNHTLSTSTQSATNGSSFGEKIVGFILIVLLLTAAYFKIYYISEIADKSILLLGNELMLEGFTITESLGFKEGIVNSLLVLGKSINQILIDLAVEFVKGFDYSLFGNILWLCFGWIWTTMKAVILFFPRYFVTLYQVFIQGSSVAYFASYIITTLFSWFLLSIMSKEN